MPETYYYPSLTRQLPGLIDMNEPATGPSPLLRERFLGFIIDEARHEIMKFFSSHVLREAQRIV